MASENVVKKLMRFFRPRSVAVIGASTKPGKVGNAVLRNLIDGGFKGKIYPVNPKAKEILGLKVYNRIKDIPGEVDHAFIAIRADTIPDIIPDLAEKNVPVAVVISSGFAEIGNHELQRKLVETARSYGIRIIGPNTYGVYCPPASLSSSFTIPYDYKGSLAVICQSGGVGMAALGYARIKRIGLSLNVGLGNMADLDHADLLEYLGEDKYTKAIALHVESIRDGRKFIRIASKVSKKKPIIVLKAGRTELGAKAAASHTAALTTIDQVVNVAFKKAGVIRAYSLEELFELGRALAMLPKPKGENVLIVTSAGGLGVLLSDACYDNNLRLMEPPEDLVSEYRKFIPPFGSFKNPMDITGSSTPDMQARAVKTAILHPEVHAIILGYWHTIITPPMEFAKSVVEAVEEARSKGVEKPIVVSLSGDLEVLKAAEYIEEKAGIPAYPFTPEKAVRALGALYEWARYAK